VHGAPATLSRSNRAPCPVAFHALLMLALCAASGALCLTGCSSPGGQPPTDAVSPTATGPSAEAFLLNALGRTVAAHENDVARRLLARVRALGPSAKGSDVADAYERILDGRDLVGTLDLSLAVRGAGDGATAPGRLVLVAHTTAGRPLELRTGPATLEVERTTVDAAGRERVDRQTRSFDTVSELLIPGEGACETELDRVAESFPPGALAQRWRWRLRVRAGEIVDAGRSYPAMRVRVTPAEVSLVTPSLKDGAVAPEELATEMAAGRLELRAALELAVRVPAEQREQALDAAAAVIEDLPLPAVARLAPALRWLAPDVDAGSDPVAWKAWLRTRGTGSARDDRSRSSDDRARLVLPR